MEFGTHIYRYSLYMHAKFQENPIYRSQVMQCIGFPIDIYSANTNPHNFFPAAWIDLKFHTHICISTMSLCVKFQVNPFCRKKVIKCIGFPIGNLKGGRGTLITFELLHGFTWNFTHIFLYAACEYV